MASKKAPPGYKWITRHGIHGNYSVLIRDKEFRLAQDKDTGSFLDNDAKPGEVEKYVSDTELYEADREQQIQYNRRQANIQTVRNLDIGQRIVINNIQVLATEFNGEIGYWCRDITNGNEWFRNNIIKLLSDLNLD